jgi:hypothetical protein
MKIKNESGMLKEAFELIKNANLGEFASKGAFLFFPFEIADKIEERETGVILVETKTEGSKNFVKSGFVVSMDSDLPLIGYAAIEYAIKLDIETHIGLFPNQKQSLNKKKLDILKEYDCYLVRDQQLLTTFKF